MRSGCSFSPGKEAHADTASRPSWRRKIPEKVARHQLAARLFHWIMAAAMFALLFTAFLPKVGYQFPWVTYHWIAGLVLTASIIFHIIHATFYMDFWSIWPDKIDIEDAQETLAAGHRQSRLRRRASSRSIRWKTRCTT